MTDALLIWISTGVALFIGAVSIALTVYTWRLLRSIHELLGNNFYLNAEVFALMRYGISRVYEQGIDDALKRVAREGQNLSYFTKGKWSCDQLPPDKNDRSIPITTPMAFIAKVLLRHDVSEMEANARLIAAAPEMYKLLTAVANYKPDIVWDVAFRAKELLARIDNEEAEHE